MFERLQNFGICTGSKCLISGPRCTFNLCALCCRKSHEYWAAHVMADGKRSPVTLQCEQRRADFLAYIGKVEDLKLPDKPEPEKAPEPGKIEELVEVEGEAAIVLIPLADNSKFSGGKSHFPVKYV